MNPDIAGRIGLIHPVGEIQFSQRGRGKDLFV